MAGKHQLYNLATISKKKICLEAEEQTLEGKSEVCSHQEQGDTVECHYWGGSGMETSCCYGKVMAKEKKQVNCGHWIKLNGICRDRLSGKSEKNFSA